VWVWAATSSTALGHGQRAHQGKEQAEVLHYRLVSYALSTLSVVNKGADKSIPVIEYE